MSREAEVRALVTRVVDEVMGGAAEGAETIAVGADHGGFQLKQELADHLQKQGWAVHDCGCASSEPVDYPDFAHAVANLVATGLLDDSDLFLNYVVYHGLDLNLEAGTFQLDPQLTLPEMAALLGDLRQCRLPDCCPHGR